MEIVTLGGLFIAFFYKIFFLKKIFFLGDNLLVIAPHKAFLLNSLKQGVFPLWNPNMWAGFPEYADSTLGLFNPFNLIYLLSPDLKGITSAALASYFLSFLGTFLLLKNEGLKKYPALIGASVFAFSGSMLNVSLDIIRLNAICFFPWTLLAIKKKNFFWTTVLLSLGILAGQFQHFYMPQLFIIGWLFFFFPKKEIKNKLIFYSLSLLFAFGLTFFTILPQFNFIQYTTRDQAGAVYNTIWSLHPASLIRFIFANFWGLRTEGSFWGPNVTYTFGYIGFFPLIFILTNLRSFKKKEYYLLFMALFTLLIAFGKYNPFHSLFLLIPGMSLFRNPSSWLIIYSFSLAYLTARIAEKRFKYSLVFKKTLLLTGIIFSILGIGLLFIYYFYPQLPNQTLKQATDLLNKNLSTIHTTQVDLGISSLFLRNFLILGTLSLLVYKWFKVRTFLLVIFLDLFLLGQGDLFLAPDKVLSFYKTGEKTQPIQYLKNNLGPYRFVSTSEFVPLKGISTYHDNYFRRPPFFPDDFWILKPEEFKSFDMFQKELALLPPNFNLHYNLASINGYSSFVLKDYQDYFSQESDNLSALALKIKEINAGNPAPFDPTTVNFDFISLDDPRIASFSVRYILADQKLEHNGFKEKELDGFYIYENQKALPRAQIVDENFNPLSSPQIIDLNANTVQVNIENFPDRGNKLVLRDIYYPGWKAFTDNGNQLQVNKYEIFRSVELEKDTKSVTFKFLPADFFLSLKVSATVLILFLTFLFFKFDQKIFFKKKQ